MLPIKPWCRCLYGLTFNRQNHKEARYFTIQRHTRPFQVATTSAYPLYSYLSCVNNIKLMLKYGGG